MTQYKNDMSLHSVGPPEPAPGPAAGPLDAAPGGFADLLNVAVEASGLTLYAIQRQLALSGVNVSVTTLSYWRRGRSRPERAASLRAVPLLEELLGLPDQALSGRLGSPRPRGRSGGIRAAIQ